ncbi:MAG TPA: hypothetical protein VF905_12060, partial [Nitrospirota bacterium]
MAKVSMEQAKEIADNSSQGTFINLPDDGDKVELVFRVKGANGQDEIDVKEQYWNEKTQKTEPYTKEHRAQHKQSKP